MARNGSGTYSKVNTFVAGNTITAAGHNQNWDDLVAEMTNSVAADGQTPLTGSLKGANGAAATPSYSFNSDPNTGVYRHGADELGFTTGGTAAGYFDSAQKLWLLGALDVTGIASFSSTSHLVLPNGTTAQRPGSPAAAHFRYNSSLVLPEYYDGSGWVSLSPPISKPQGRLTLVSATPIMASDASAQSTVYYTPYEGNLIPIYNGTSFVMTAFAELSMVMSGANFASGGIYDLFVASDSGTLRLAIGPVWATLTAGSGARGTGAGTTELQMVNGILTNKVSATLRYASGSTFTAAANKATYVGSMYLDGTNSQVTCHVSYGQSRKWGLWNAYNRKPIYLKAGDNTANWNTASATIRASNNDSNNKLTIFAGLPEEFFDLSFFQRTDQLSGTPTHLIGIGYNSTTTQTGFAGRINSPVGPNVARYLAPPAIGINNIQAVESDSTAAGTARFYGSEPDMLLSGMWLG